MSSKNKLNNCPVCGEPFRADQCGYSYDNSGENAYVHVACAELPIKAVQIDYNGSKLIIPANDMESVDIYIHDLIEQEDCVFTVEIIYVPWMSIQTFPEHQGW